MKRISLLLFAACAADPSLGQSTDELGNGRVQVTGDLAIWGCTPNAQDIVITASRARPMGNQHLEAGDDGDDGGGRGRPGTAIVTATQDPHVFRVRFAKLHARETYRMQARFRDPSVCPKTVWRGPHGGWLSPAANQPLHIDGMAMTTQVEVLATRNGNPVWVGADAIDLRSDSSRAIRWRSSLPNVAGAIVQISSERFPVGGNAQQQQQPLLASYAVQAPQQGGWATLPAIDFAQFAELPCDGQLQQQQNIQACDHGPPTPQRAVAKEIGHGAPVFVRVIPISTTGEQLMDSFDHGIAAHVKVAHLPDFADLVPPPPPPPPQPPFALTGTYQEAQNQMCMGHTACYRVLEDHTIPDFNWCFFHYGFAADPWGCKVSMWHFNPTGDGILHAGQWFWVDVHDDGGSWLDDIVDAVSGLIDDIGSLVNDIAKLYDDIKHAVVDLAAKIVSTVVECDETCKTYLMGALDTGLAAMGLPPSLPNFDELKERGWEYLRDEAVEETGIPPAAFDKLKEVAGEAIHDMRSHGVDELDPWLVGDDGFRSMNLTLTVARNFDSTTPPPSQLLFYSEGDHLGAQVDLPMSGLNAGQTYTIPITFLPKVYGLSDDQLTAEDLWFNTRYNASPCQRFLAYGEYIGKAGGSDWYLGSAGIQMYWSIPTHPGFSSSEALLPLACY